MLNIIKSFFIYSGLPSNITINWNYGSILGIILGIQIITGITLGMHYTAHIDLAFLSVEHIMRNVQYGWLIRYLHANGASLFFLFVYLHIARGLYVGSYIYPRNILWNIGVIIYFLMTATGFLGYVLPMGQMSIWGNNCPKCINQKREIIKMNPAKRIESHNYKLLSIFIGSLLGNAHAQYFNDETRICFYQENTHKNSLLYLYNLILNEGGDYCTKIEPKIQTKLSKYGKKRKYIIFNTYYFNNLNWIYNAFYNKEGKKIVPNEIVLKYLSPLALAIWIMDNGYKTKNGLNIATNVFTYIEIKKLCNILNTKYKLSTNIHSANILNQYIINIPKKDVNKIYLICKDHIHPSMKYKFIC